MRVFLPPLSWFICEHKPKKNQAFDTLTKLYRYSSLKGNSHTCDQQVRASSRSYAWEYESNEAILVTFAESATKDAENQRNGGWRACSPCPHPNIYSSQRSLWIPACIWRNSSLSNSGFNRNYVDGAKLCLGSILHNRRINHYDPPSSEQRSLYHRRINSHLG